jgi:membrane-bound ClpP family serine protease
MLRRLVHEYEYIHLTIGILGNAMFVVGSVLFYKAFESLYPLAVTLFVVGSSFMLTGSLGSAAKKLWKYEKTDDESRRSQSHRGQGEHPRARQTTGN